MSSLRGADRRRGGAGAGAGAGAGGSRADSDDDAEALAPLPTVVNYGSSDSSAAGRLKALRAFEAFLEYACVAFVFRSASTSSSRPPRTLAPPRSKPRYPLLWRELKPDIVCNKLIYLELAAFLMDVYTYTLGKEGEELALALSTQRHYLRYMLHAAQREYGHLHQHKPFFGCLVAGASFWLSAAEVSVERAVTTACALAGTTVVTSATPVHRKHALEIARAYARFHGLNHGGDGVLKRLAIVLLWIAVGRTAEVAMLCFDLCEWDTHYNCLAIWWYHSPRRPSSRRCCSPRGATRPSAPSTPTPTPLRRACTATS